MTLAILLLFSGLAISGVAEFYSIMGLMAIFSAAPIPIAVMGISLGVGKLVMASWLKAYWDKAPTLMKYYGVISVIVLILITTLGCFGYLSKAHSDQSLVSGDVGSKIAIYDEKIKTARENIDTNRRQLKQMDEAVDQLMGRSTDEKGADKANAVRKSQQKDRAALAKDIEVNQKIVAALNDEAAPIRAEIRKVDAEVGPIKYIAAFIYGTEPDSTMLEKAVTWVIILIVVVFDPLAVVMLLASQMTFKWAREEIPTVKDYLTVAPEVIVQPAVIEEVIDEDPVPAYEQDDGPLTEAQIKQIKEIVGVAESPFDFDTHPYLFTPVNPPADFERELPQVYTPEVITAAPSGELLIGIRKSENAQLAPIADEEFEEVHIQRDAYSIRGGDSSHHVIRVPTAIVADNELDTSTSVKAHFGTQFPSEPERGEMFLKVDVLPSVLYKYNGVKWMVVDKALTDSYVYNDEYIRHLVSQIENGILQPEELNATEQEQITEFLKK